MTGFLLITLAIAQMLVIWFETDAFIEYIKLFQINKLIVHFNKYTSQKNAPNYKEYLVKHHNNFFTRLITCYICLGTALSGIFSTLVGWVAENWVLGLSLWLPIAFISLLWYKIFTKLNH